MHFDPNNIYHVFNRGNNKQRIFFKRKNYHYFLEKVKNEWLNFCDIYSYCLMPNHFHFMLEPNFEACKYLWLGEKESHLQKLSRAIGNTLSSYAQGINVQNKTIGTLFQKKTKAKCLTDIVAENSQLHLTDYLINCFSYIHLNPLEAKLVQRLEDWPYSSWPFYAGLKRSNFCNKDKWLSITDMKLADILNQNQIVFAEDFSDYYM